MSVPDAVTGAFLALRDAVIAAQAAYRQVHGVYWQGGATNGDARVRVPDVPESWADLGMAPPSGQTAAVDEYAGPQGEGFVVRSSYTDRNGASWSRSDQTGPETYRDSGGWQADA